MKGSTTPRKPSTTPTTTSSIAAYSAIRSRQNDVYEDYSEVCRWTSFPFVSYSLSRKRSFSHFSLTCYLRSIRSSSVFLTLVRVLLQSCECVFAQKFKYRSTSRDWILIREKMRSSVCFFSFSFAFCLGCRKLAIKTRTKTKTKFKYQSHGW